MSKFSENAEDTYRKKTLYGSIQGRAFSELCAWILIPLGSTYLWGSWAFILVLGILFYIDPYRDAVIVYVRAKRGIK